VFGELYVYGGNPTHAPGDVLRLEAPVGAVTGLLPSGFNSGQAIIDEMLISYWEIEAVDSAFPTPSPEGDAYGDFDGNGIVDGDDLTHPLLGFYARFGKSLDGNDFLAWQKHLGQKPPAESNALVGAAVADEKSDLSSSAGRAAQLMLSASPLNPAAPNADLVNSGLFSIDSLFPTDLVVKPWPGGTTDTMARKHQAGEFFAELAQYGNGEVSSSSASAWRQDFRSAAKTKHWNHGMLNEIDLAFTSGVYDFKRICDVQI
jgi:hypothetical protein